MKTTTLVNPETQVNLETPGRIQQLKLGVDWHADHFRVVRMFLSSVPISAPAAVHTDPIPGN